jgi:DNA-binding CsgD family transcriptional regulator
MVVVGRRLRGPGGDRVERAGVEVVMGTRRQPRQSASRRVTASRVPASIPTMRPSLLPALANRLNDARDFVEVAVQVCGVASELGAHECAMTLHAESGRPVLCVDNVHRWTRDHRVDYFAEQWIGDPTLHALREHHAPIEGAGVLAIPLLASGGLLGSIRFLRREPHAIDLGRDLRALGTHVSVRLAQLKVQAPPESQPMISSLTHRQLWVALLAARHKTNGEIAELLDLSENTVKKHLKDVFERIRIRSRTELVSLITRASFPHDMSELAGVVVTRA